MPCAAIVCLQHACVAMCSHRLSVGLFSPLFWLLLLPGDREAEEREAHVGAQAAVGRDEVCLWGPSLPPLDEPLCWLPIQVAADEDQERRLRVLCMSLQSSNVCRHPCLVACKHSSLVGRWSWPADGAMSLDHGPQALVISRVYCQEKHAVPGGHPRTILTLGMSCGP